MGFFLQKWDSETVSSDFPKRLKDLRLAKDLKIETLGAMIGVGKSSINRWENGDTFPDYREMMMIINATKCNGTWLMFGQEDMFNSTTEVDVKKSFISKTDKVEERQIVKLYNMEAVAGFMPIFENRMEVVDYLDIPNIPKCDGGIFIRGDSMKPIMERGDVALYKFINNQDEWMYGKIHIISYEQSDGFIKTVIKYLNRVEDKEVVRLTSNNEDYNYNDIKTSRIKAVAQVMAIVRVNVFF